MSVTKEKTAVDWFVDELQKAEYIPKDSILMDYVIGLGNEKFMQQIISAYRDGRSDQQSERPSRFYNRNAEQYYNETFKTK